MLRFILRRMLWAVVMVVAITMVSYTLFFVIPTEQGQIGPRRSGGDATNLRESVAVEGPIYKEYGLFLWRIGHGSFGISWSSERNVNEVLLAALPVTLSLVLGGMLFWMMLAIPIGILSALRPRTLLDRSATVFVLIGISVHPVFLGLILSYVFGVKARLFPFGGYCDLRHTDYVCSGLIQWSWHLVLPWLTFGMLYAALYSRMIRASVLETANEDYVRTARAKGASGAVVIRSHVLRNAALPVVTMLGMDLGYWIGSALFVETVFGLPGVGRLLTTSLARRDLPVLMAIVVSISILIVILNLVVDLVYGYIDPRVRFGSGAGGGKGFRLRPRSLGRLATDRPALGSSKN